MSCIDSHAHLSAPEFRGEADALLERARAAGVEAIVSVGSGYGVEGNAGAIELAQRYDNVWATAGVHPHEASEWSSERSERVRDWLGRARVVAVGECGLDYHYDHSPREIQIECLRAQIGLAHAAALPLVVHARASQGSRDAFVDLLRIFDEEGADRCGGVMHCFTGDLETANECLSRGFDISFSGILTFRNATELREVARALPLDRLLVETDSPFLAPVPHRGHRNEPAFVVHVVDTLAELHGCSPAAVAKATRERTLEAFAIGDGA